MRRLLSVLALLACCSTAATGANKITGSVYNLSRGESAAGDEVILVGLDSGREEARAKTDAQGAFTLKVHSPDKPYLVRVVHQGVSYDQQASPGDALSVEVFDAAPHVRSVTSSIEILRAGTNGNLLHVSDMLEIKNESSPPLTQAGERTFEVYLPANATLDSVLAAGPGKISVTVSAVAVPIEPGHYSVNFPLRPGATKFAFNYDLPYRGHAEFHTRHAYPLQQLAVMIPPTMNFSSPSSAFKLLATGNRDYQVQAATHVNAGEGPAFEISGTGTLPPIREQAKSQAPSRPPAVPNLTTSAASRTAVHSSARIGSGSELPQSSSQSLVLGVLTVILLAACALLIWRGRKLQKVTHA